VHIIFFLLLLLFINGYRRSGIEKVLKNLRIKSALRITAARYLSNSKPQKIK
jgi:hypothetical protein